MGSIEALILDLIEGNGSLELKLHPEDENGVSLGIRKALVREVPSFIDYIQAGLDLNLIAGVDFTASNGEPHRPGSIHYFDPSKLP